VNGDSKPRRRSKAVPITVAALLGSGLLAGCGSNSNQKAYDQVCADKNGQRISDAKCDGSQSGGTGGIGNWYYIPRGSGYNPPPVGSPVQGGSNFAPTSGTSFSGVNETTGGAGTVNRGGFGGKSGTVGG
jgi:hypothetical protein